MPAGLSAGRPSWHGRILLAADRPGKAERLGSPKLARKKCQGVGRLIFSRLRKEAEAATGQQDKGLKLCTEP